MTVAESSVRFPITVIVRVLLVVVFGYVCLTFLEVELKPDTRMPVLAISTDFPGAAPEEVEGEVLTRFEQSISGVSNLVAPFGYAYFGQSFIFVLYRPGTNLDLAAPELQINIERVTDLPAEVEKSQILEATEFMDLPVSQFALQGDVDIVTMSRWADLVIAPMMKRIPGIGECTFAGERIREMRITFDPERLKARRLTVSEIKGYIDRTNLNRSGGYFLDGPHEWTVRLLGELLSARAFSKVIISKPGDKAVYLSEVATVTDTYERPESDCRIDGVPGLIFNVYSEVGANIIKAIGEVNKRIALLQKKYGPYGVKFRKMYDQSDFIWNAVNLVQECLLLAVVLILIVLYVFLRDWRSTVIVGISIPVSIVGTFIGMYLFGYSINIISLAGLALAIGLIVDDSVIVLENIHRHRYEEGKGVFRACVDGTGDVGMAAFMSTLTTAAVFLPIFMLRGEIGTLFAPVAFVVSFAVFVSLFDAFTVVPMLASRWMREPKPDPNTDEKTRIHPGTLERLGRKFSDRIIGFLRFMLEGNVRKAVMVVVVLGIFVWSLKVLPGMNYLPLGGTNLIRVHIECIEGTNLAEISRLMGVLEERYKKIKGVRHIVSIPNRKRFRNAIYLICDREEESGVPIVDIAQEASRIAKDLPLKTVNPMQFPLFGNIYLRSNVMDLRITGDSYQVIEPIVEQIMKIGRHTRGIIFRYTDLALDKPEVHIRVDHERAAHLGFEVIDIANAVEAAVGGRRTKSQYDVAGTYYYIRVMGDEQDMKTVSDVGKIVLTSPTDPQVQIPLTSVARVEATIGPAHITHFQGVRATRIQFTIHGRPLGEIFQEVFSKIKSSVGFPHGYAAIPFGAANLLKRLKTEVRFVFALSVVVVYLLLVMQFQSFIRPLSIMLSVPLSIIGANFLIWITGVPFDAFTMLGYVMMVGLVVKNAILLITYAVKLMDKEGVDRDEALVLASKRRLRPIYMTSIAMVVGMLPLAVRDGAGAEIYNGLAMGIVGGLSVATLFTLVFIPVVFTLLDDLETRFWKPQPIIFDDPRSYDT